ncbi:MAG: coproporphyrinogen-III oxidase family protein [Acidobacteriaceae bacterium]
MPLGLYLSVPFCRTKCSFCNFASGVFSRPLFDRYVSHLERELGRAEQIACEMGGVFEREVDSVYLGGGTPSILAPDQLGTLFQAVRNNFAVLPGAEITVEVAPGTLSPEILKVLLEVGANRVSLGMQSFVDQETRSVGRLHTREITLADIARLRENGIKEISLDLIAGLPHQTAESWRYSLAETVSTGVPHVSVYMLEVDEDSRLGRELIAGGTRYHAHHVPDDDATADFYLEACETFDGAGLKHYEISNFASDGGSPHLPNLGRCGAPEDSCSFPEHASRHNLKYWLRQPYLGFGVDAHSMLCAPRRDQPHAAVRFATTDNLDALLAGAAMSRTVVEEKNAIEEVFFLGLRLNRGVNLRQVADEFGEDAVERYHSQIAEMTESDLVVLEDGWLRLTNRGRLLSNDVFSRFLAD